MMPDISVEFQPPGRRVEIQIGATLLEAARRAGVNLLATCGGQGTCHACRVRIASGAVSAPTPEEQTALTPAEQEAGLRLACQCIARGDVRVELPPESLSAPQRLSLEGLDTQVTLDPPVRPLEVNLEPPSLSDPRSDATRLLAAIQASDAHLSRRLLTSLSEHLRRQAWKARLAVRGREIIALLPPTNPLLGLAVDLGTTKLAAYLVNLETGLTLAQTGRMNPQIIYGEDVISRIHYANTHPDGREKMQSCVVEALNQMVKELVTQVHVRAENIVEAVVVGNTAMHHLFAGLPVKQLGESPYVPAVSDALEFPAAEIGLEIAPAACIYLPPNIAGYVGADHVAMALAAEVHRTHRTVLAVDIGTNTEISLAVNGRLFTCSCASGPAFEGAHITDGMRAAPGAIEKVSIGETIRVTTIENLPPVGICGSGVLDAVAELTRVGALDRRGNFKTGHPLVQSRAGKHQVVLIPAEASGHGRPITLSRADIHEIQLAKGAIRAGLEILLSEAGIRADELDEILVAGAFGTYLDLESALRVGMFPPVPLQKFRQIGNAAGTGARQLLLSRKRRQEADDFARRTCYVELTRHKQFLPLFTRGMMLEPMQPDTGPNAAAHN
ncbi:MAG: ASKHA domain-containing protein [Anaerolineales bacterium]|nr:ASKHA domain-containing protein [Anaerolineales bacterium]